MRNHFLKSTICILCISISVSIIVFLFGVCVDFCFDLFISVNWLALLLPIFGIIGYSIYRWLKIDHTTTTPDIIHSISHDNNIPTKLTPAIFIGTCLSTLGGGSVGKEAAALQIGASLSQAICNIFSIRENKELFHLCGMASGMSMLLSCPLASTFFVYEIIGFYNFTLKNFFAVLFSSFIPFIFSLLSGIRLFQSSYTNLLSIDNIGYVLLLCFCLSLLSIAISLLFSGGRKILKRISIPSPAIIAIVGVLLGAILFLPGMNVYSGTGINSIIIALNGEITTPFFIGKMLFMIAFLSFGYKGGEIMPTMCIGATFGCFFGNMVGIDPIGGAMLGMVGMLSGCTNTPIACVLIGCELFGFQNILWFVLSSCICFLLTMNMTYYRNTQIYDSIRKIISVMRTAKSSR